MKKILKSCAAIVLAFVCFFGFAACGTKLSETTVSTSKVLVSNGKSTNAGMTVVHNGYLYFINGSKTNDGSNLKDNTVAAICRVKYNESTGKITSSTYEVVVDSLVGFEDGSLYVFGDFLYYATPSADVNSQDTVLYSKTKFMRYDLVNKKSYELYTTKLNDSSETLVYTYYVVGDSLNLVVYESVSATITSLKINKKVTTNYVIDGVTSCVMSENFGKTALASDKVDANSYVFYTKAYSGYSEPYRDGVKVYRVSPVNKNTVHCLSNEGKQISLLTIRNGKLFYSMQSSITSNSIVYCQKITGATNEKLGFADNEFNYNSYADEIFIENEDGSVSLLYLDPTSYELFIIEKNAEGNSTTTILNKFTKPSSSGSSSSQEDTFAMIGLATINEVIKEDNPATEDVNEEKKADITYLVVMDNSLLYKVEIARTVDGVKTLSEKASIIQLSNTKFIMPTTSSLLIPEIIDNYVYAMAKELDDQNKETGNTYLYRADISVKETTKVGASHIGIEEPEE